MMMFKLVFFPHQILQILVKAVVENLTDSQGEQAGALQSKLKELLGRVSSRHSSDAEIWRQYALLYGDGHSSNPENDDKVSNMHSHVFVCLFVFVVFFILTSLGSASFHFTTIQRVRPALHSKHVIPNGLFPNR